MHFSLDIHTKTWYNRCIRCGESPYFRVAIGLHTLTSFLNLRSLAAKAAVSKTVIVGSSPTAFAISTKDKRNMHEFESALSGCGSLIIAALIIGSVVLLAAFV